MIGRLVTTLRRHLSSALLGVLAGGLIATGWLTWVVNFAPYDDDTSSVWSANVTNATGSPNASRQIYQPRYDELIRRLQVNGRFGGLAWQNLQEVSEAWLLAQPIEALNHLIRSGGIGLIDDTLLASAIESAAKGNFATALGLAEDLESATIRARWIRVAFEQLSIRNPAAAFDALSTLPSRLKIGFTYNLATTWAEKDPLNAFHTFLKGDAMLIGAIASTWAEKDPEAAVAFFLQAPPAMPSANGREVSAGQMLRYVMQSLAQENPEKALELLPQIQKAISTTFRTQAISRVAQTDPHRALALATTASGDLERLAILSIVASAAEAKGSADLAAQVYAQLPGERAKSNAAARRVWDGVNYEHPKDAVANLDQITDPIAHSDALHSVTSVWLSKKPGELARFANEQSRTGNVLWIRAMADTLVDWKDQGARSAPELREHLSAEVLEQLRQEIANQSFPGSSDKLLKALGAE
ncbi:MAG: hypothetical protein ACO1QR_17380 [Chthoniobacteraceae bacterium]